MPALATKLVAFVKPWSLLGTAILITIGAVPARAQDLFGFFRPFIAPVPTYQPYEYRPLPPLERPRPKVRPRPKPVPVEPAVIKMPETPKAPGETRNPVPDLLTDSTLRPGDMVMFPDGLRVFTGQAGGQHKLLDFKPVSQAGKALPASTRKQAGQLRPGANVAWSADGVSSGGKLAAKVKGVETTGSVRRTDR